MALSEAEAAPSSSVKTNGRINEDISYFQPPTQQEVTQGEGDVPVCFSTKTDFTQIA